jgi:hypothetical protein
VRLCLPVCLRVCLLARRVIGIVALSIKLAIIRGKLNRDSVLAFLKSFINTSSSR